MDTKVDYYEKAFNNNNKTKKLTYELVNKNKGLIYF